MSYIEKIKRARKEYMRSHQRMPTKVKVSPSGLDQINNQLWEDFEKTVEERMAKEKQGLPLVLPEAPQYVSYGDYVFGMKIVEKL